MASVQVGSPVTVRAARPSSARPRRVLGDRRRAGRGGELRDLAVALVESQGHPRWAPPSAVLSVRRAAALGERDHPVRLSAQDARAAHGDDRGPQEVTAAATASVVPIP